MSLNETQKAKKRLRQTKAWKQLRHDKNVEQRGFFENQPLVDQYFRELDEFLYKENHKNER